MATATAEGASLVLVTKVNVTPVALSAKLLGSFLSADGVNIKDNSHKMNKLVLTWNEFTLYCASNQYKTKAKLMIKY